MKQAIIKKLDDELLISQKELAGRYPKGYTNSKRAWRFKRKCRIQGCKRKANISSSKNFAIAKKDKRRYFA